MAKNAFAGHAERSTEGELVSALGQASSYSVKAGRWLRRKLKKRNIVYLGPRPGYFLASFVLGEKAVAEGRKSKLPTRVLKMIAAAKRHPEGTAIRIEVRAPKPSRSKEPWRE